MSDINARTDAVMAWYFTPHACRICFGRVMCYVHFDRRRTYRCSCCGVAREGADESVICGCGIRLKGGRDAGWRCVENKERRPECPAEIVIRPVDPLAVPALKPAPVPEPELA
jgi:hypothetical protein